MTPLMADTVGLPYEIISVLYTKDVHGPGAEEVSQTVVAAFADAGLAEAVHSQLVPASNVRLMVTGVAAPSLGAAAKAALATQEDDK